MPRLYAQPYDITATGFFFETTREYQRRIRAVWNACGDPVEEFDIQFIDGEPIDAAFAKAIGLSQANLSAFFTCVETWEFWEKLHVIIAVEELGVPFDPDIDPDHYGIDVYYVSSLRDLAEQFVDEGLLGDIPEHLRSYIDLDAFARDLAMDYTETEIAGERLIYRAT